MRNMIQTSKVILICIAVSSMQAQADENITLWGMGVKSCFSFNHVYEDWGNEKDFGLESYPVYREWLMGLITGISATTGLEVLHGTDPDSAMRRISLICKDNPGMDFFNATMTHLGRLSVPGISGSMVSFPGLHQAIQSKSIPSALENPFPSLEMTIPMEPTPIQLKSANKKDNLVQSTKKIREQHPRISNPPAIHNLKNKRINKASDHVKPAVTDLILKNMDKSQVQIISIEKKFTSSEIKHQSAPAPIKNQNSTITRIAKITENSIQSEEIPSDISVPNDMKSNIKPCIDQDSIASNLQCKKL